MWYQSLTTQLKGRQLVNDSKTPSGTVHVGSLRGVLIHDAIYRSLKYQGIDAQYIYGFDDYDPMDGLPVQAGEELRKYMGMPLCNIPAPKGSTATDLADHYTQEFLTVFKELGVEANIYRTRDLYRQGTLNQSIDTILHQSATIRQIYKQVSGSEKPDDWYPFQVICQSCGKIGTTRVSNYSDGQVSYTCELNLVSWAHGCGHSGRVSPLDGTGKLPWKLEWVAKWASLGISIEGAGKDHSTKGGARDVATQCLQQIFKQQAPHNIPYEFFLIQGTKMSSSKGIGTSARQMADFLPPALLRFLMIRTAPKRSVNFSTDLNYIVKLYNDYDTLLTNGQTNNEAGLMMRMIQPHQELLVVQPIGFQLITALLQLPHIQVNEELNKRYQLNQKQQRDLQQRITSARYWLAHFADESDRITLQERLPPAVHALDADQKAFLYLLGNCLSAGIHDEQCQQLVFDCARLIPIESKKAFHAVYTTLLNADHGPKAGSLLAYIDVDFLQTMLTGVEPPLEQFITQTTTNTEDFARWLDAHTGHIEYIKAVTIQYQQLTRIQLHITLNNNRQHMFRLPTDASFTQLDITPCTSIQLSSWQNNWRDLTGIQHAPPDRSILPYHRQ